MTTAAARLAELGVEMTVAQAFVLNLAQTGQATGLLNIAATYGITAAMLGEIVTYPGTPASEIMVHEWFHANGIDSSGIATVHPSVQSVSSPTATEGSSFGFVVTLDATTVVPELFGLGIGGSATLGDFSSFHFSHGVTITDDYQFSVPAGVSSFTVTMVTADDTTVEGAETFAINVGGVIGTATINDNDAQQPSGMAMMPAELAGMLPIVQLNNETGVLSTANLRAEIIAGSNVVAYNSLFDASGYVGAGDGVFTNAEAGWTIGDQPATSETMESVFYGTLIHALKAVDNAEMSDIGAFTQTHEALLDQGDEATYATLIAKLVAAFEDPAPSNDQAFTDGMIHEAVVEVGVDLVAMAQHEPSIFHGLLNWL